MRDGTCDLRTYNMFVVVKPVYNSVDVGGRAGRDRQQYIESKSFGVIKSALMYLKKILETMKYESTWLGMLNYNKN